MIVLKQSKNPTYFAVIEMAVTPLSRLSINVRVPEIFASIVPETSESNKFRSRVGF